MTYVYFSRVVKVHSCYTILGLKPGASLQEIKQARRDLVEVWHPDRFSHNPRLQKIAEAKLKEINAAYEELTSPQPASRPVYRQTSKPKDDQSRTEPGKNQHDSNISFEEAKTILAKHRFRLVKEVSGSSRYKSAPFQLDFKQHMPEVILSVPCKRVGTFHQANARELMHLLINHLDDITEARQFEMRVSLSRQISFQQAKQIVAQYRFKLIKQVPYSYTLYESEPFRLNVKEHKPEVIVSIPAESVGTFHQSDARELINQLRATLTSFI